MHGTVMQALKDFFIDTYDRGAWKKVRGAAVDREQPYVAMDNYPDEELYAIVRTAVKAGNFDEDSFLEAFGEYLVGELLGVYRSYVRDEWTAMDLVANAEERIHARLRGRNDYDFDPPELETHRINEDRVVLEYRSDRELCALAIGMIRGIGEHYDTQLTVTEQQCLKEGAESCQLDVRRSQPDDEGEGVPVSTEDGSEAETADEDPVTAAEPEDEDDEDAAEPAPDRPEAGTVN